MAETRPLDDLQRWFHTAVTHPGELRQIAPDLESVVTESSQQSSEARLEVYARSYWARLLECLREEHPTVRAAVGDEAFDQLAVGYLQERPSTSYTLAELGASFAEYLSAHSPNDDFSRAIVELATLERNINEVFDLPGGETLGFLAPAELAAVPSASRGDLQLAPLPTFRLLTFEYDVNDWFTRLRAADDAAELPPKQPSFVALSRREFIVRRHALSAVQAELLTALAGRAALGDALATTIERRPTAMPELTTSLESWFAVWAAAGFFQSLSR